LVNITALTPELDNHSTTHDPAVNHYCSNVVRAPVTRHVSSHAAAAVTDSDALQSSRSNQPARRTGGSRAMTAHTSRKYGLLLTDCKLYWNYKFFVMHMYNFCTIFQVM